MHYRKNNNKKLTIVLVLLLITILTILSFFVIKKVSSENISQIDNSNNIDDNKVNEFEEIELSEEDLLETLPNPNFYTQEKNYRDISKEKIKISRDNFTEDFTEPNIAYITVLGNLDVHIKDLANENMIFYWNNNFNNNFDDFQVLYETPDSFIIKMKVEGDLVFEFVGNGSSEVQVASKDILVTMSSKGKQDIVFNLNGIVKQTTYTGGKIEYNLHTPNKSSNLSFNNLHGGEIVIEKSSDNFLVKGPYLRDMKISLLNKDNKVTEIISNSTSKITLVKLLDDFKYELYEEQIGENNEKIYNPISLEDKNKK